MAPRPAKRQRRSTIVLSDDSDGDFESPSSQAPRSGLQREITRDGRNSLTASPAKSGKAKATKKRAAPKASPKSSPEKTRQTTLPREAEKSRSLHSFFGRATEEERWSKKAETPEQDWVNGELDDAIEDDDLSDETLQELGVRPADGHASLNRPKSVVPAITSRSSAVTRGSVPASQRFFKSAPSSQSATGADDAHPAVDVYHLPWADRYGPSTLEELVVHKKKVADVQGWLQGKMNGRNNQKLLVLKGPAGSGKTTTLSLLAKAMGLQLVSWHNPAVSDAGVNSSIAFQFDEFLNRGGQFGSLVFGPGSPDSTSTKANPDHRVLVVEEFPATISRFSSALQSFRSVILRFLARGKTASSTFTGSHDPHDNAPALVMIISETLLSSAMAASDSFTAHRLLGPEILNHPFVTVMDFNPVASTFVTKALDLVMKKEARDSRRRRMPGPAVIQRLAEMGDVRSAVNSLEFLCLRGGDGSEWSGTVASTTKKVSKDKDRVSLTEMERNSLQLVTQRETTLDMFHAAGKIMYNKREDPRVLDTRAEPPPKPPDHLMHLYTPKASQVDIEALLNETGTDIQTFISTLHQNYILSCHGDTFEESFEGCSDVLSTADILNPESRPSRRAASNPNASIMQANLQAGSSDTLRQDEISFQVATRGLLFNLPYPVHRASPPGGKKGDAFKMFYPASLRLWKPREEMESLIDMFVHDPRSGAGLSLPHGGGGGDGGRDGGVASWQTRTFGPDFVSAPVGQTDDDDEDKGRSVEPRPVHRGKDTLVAEILPYMTRILGARKQDTSVLERVTTFNPTAFLSTTTSGEDADLEAEALHDEHDESPVAFVSATSGPKPSSHTGPRAASSTTSAKAKAQTSTTVASASASASAALRASDHSRNHEPPSNTGAFGHGPVGGDSLVPVLMSVPMPPALEKLYISDDDIEDD